MADESRLRRFAVLIDAENTSPRIAAGLFDEVAKFGEASVRRIYGDFSNQRLKSWTEILPKFAIDPYQQFAYTSGKNASDIAMVIDAMDLLHSGRLDGFCLVSSDSDFTRLASRLREQGADVYGFGEQKTPESLRQACRRFIYTENLLPEAQTTTPEEGRRIQGSPATQRGHSHPEQGHRADGDGGRMGRIGRGGTTTCEHRLRLRPADLRFQKTQRPGPKDRGIRHGTAGGADHSNPGKADTTIEGQGDQAATVSLSGTSFATSKFAARSPPRRRRRRRAARPPSRRAAPGCGRPPTVPDGGSAPPSPSSRAAASVR